MVVSSLDTTCERVQLALLDGEMSWAPDAIVAAGVGHVPEGREVFGGLALQMEFINRDALIAIMAAREGLAFDTAIESDSAPLADLIEALLSQGIEIHCLRDLTRGGLASALNEIAEAAEVTIRIEEDQIPIEEAVRGACEILGLDPLYVANEGRFVAFIAPRDAELALSILRADPLGTHASLIGRVTEDGGVSVVMKSTIGTDRRVDMLAGNQLPRIC